MLVNMNEVLAAVQTRGCCVGAFDTPNLEILMAVIRAAEKTEGAGHHPARPAS